MLQINFNIVSFNEIECGNKSLHKKLIDASKNDNFQDIGLTKYLLQRFEDVYCIEGRYLDYLDLAIDIKNVKTMQSKGKRSLGEIYEFKWWKLSCATKNMDISYNNFFIKKMSILVGLSYSNLITYYFAAKLMASIYI